MKNIGIVISIMLLAGCSPLQQAPLVYSSQFTIGVSASSNPSGSSPLDVSIGLRQTDAAYVPTAVSKDGRVRCVKMLKQGNADKEICKYSPQQVNLITARHDDLSGETAEPEDEEKEKDALENLSAKSGSDQVNLKDLSALQDKNKDKILDTLNIDSDELKKAISNLKENKLFENQSGATGGSKLIRSILGNEQLTSKIISDPVVIRSVNNTIKATPETSVKAKMALNDKSDKKTDALSVYGKFSAETEASPSKTGLTAGKIFSTGIAAQNLTGSARLQAKTECLGMVKTLAESQENKKDFVKEHIAICK
jgi:hypothetical protein